MYVVVFFLLFMAFAVPLPLILMEKGFIAKTVPNIILSGVAFFYFGFLVTKIINRWMVK
ncbi:hypothetical protein Maes01_00655 [Microbulbifer aestuariivivens]|uniref:Uncharacterized protein n=1 Tax=Microbulbifer aestuariivivens TaxID=1908308 RepID=A0ABP9WLN0_9GAMM